jgi:hypothetical protein
MRTTLLAVLGLAVLAPLLLVLLRRVSARASSRSAYDAVELADPAAAAQGAARQELYDAAVTASIYSCS